MGRLWIINWEDDSLFQGYITVLVFMWKDQGKPQETSIMKTGTLKLGTEPRPSQYKAEMLTTLSLCLIQCQIWGNDLMQMKLFIFYQLHHSWH